jgi:hypothetical protein
METQSVSQLVVQPTGLLKVGALPSLPLPQRFENEEEIAIKRLESLVVTLSSLSSVESELELALRRRESFIGLLCDLVGVLTTNDLGPLLEVITEIQTDIDKMRPTSSKLLDILVEPWQ